MIGATDPFWRSPVADALPVNVDRFDQIFPSCGYPAAQPWNHLRVAHADDPGHETVIIASFPTRRAAEHMLASLGREFRLTARKGRVSAFVVSENADGSLELTQSRVLTAGGLGAALIRVSLAWTVGLMGIFSSVKGGAGYAHAVRMREGHVGSDEQPAHAILAEAGPHAGAALIRCKDQAIAEKVTDRAAERAVRSWHGSLAEFLADLDPGSKHDWVRKALGEPSDGNG
jgi:hypothetical protein